MLNQRHSSDPAGLAPVIRAHRSSGCASLSICRIARGELDAYASAKLAIWDWAAALILLKETGGRASAARPGRGDDERAKRAFIAAGSPEIMEGLAAGLLGSASGILEEI